MLLLWGWGVWEGCLLALLGRSCGKLSIYKFWPEITEGKVVLGVSIV